MWFDFQADGATDKPRKYTLTRCARSAGRLISPILTRAVSRFARPLVLLVVTAWWSWLPAPSAQSSPDLVIKNVTLIDAESGLRPGMDVQISGGLIKSVSPIARQRGAVSTPPRERLTQLPKSEPIDGKGKYLIPGLWDMHVHSFWTKELLAQHLRLFIAHGVVGVRDMGSPIPLPELFPWARSLLNEFRYPVRVLFAGNLLDGDPPVWKGSIAVSQPDQAIEAVRDLKRHGVDCIKVYSRLGRDAYLAAAREARRQGLPVVGHLPIGITPWEAVEAGQQSIEHSSELLLACSSEESNLRKALTETKPGPEREAVRRRQVLLLSSTFDRTKAVRLARLFRDRRIYLVPTLVANRVFAAPKAVEYNADSLSRYVPRTTIENWRKRISGFLESRSPEEIRAQKQAYERELEVLKIMRAEGVAIMTGTDADLFAPAGFGLHDELRLLVSDAGLKPHEALEASTRTAARYLNRPGITGNIGVGAVADLVLLDANPIADISNTRRIAAVISNGQYLSREAIAKLRDEVERIVRAQ